MSEEKEIQDLLTKVVSPDLKIQDAAIQDLSQIGLKAVPFIIDTMQKHSKKFPTILTRSLILMGSTVVPYLLDVVQNIREDFEVRFWCLHCIGQIGDQQAIDTLIVMFSQETNSGLRTAIVDALGTIGAPQATIALITALKDLDVSVRTTAVRHLGVFGGHTMFEPLTNFYLAEKNSNARMWSVLSLGKLNDNRAFDFLAKVFNSEPDVSVRAEIITAFGYLGDARATTILAKTLQKEKAWLIRLRAVQALGKLGGKEAVEPLIKTLKDKNGSIRIYAVLSLGKIGDKRAIPALQTLVEKDDYIEYDIHEIAGVSIKEEVEKTIQILKSEKFGA